MTEQTFFDSGDVRVTNARFMVGTQTYAMNGVTSVKSSSTPPNRTVAAILLVVGLLMFFGGDGGTKVFGLLVAALGGWMIYSAKGEYAVVLSSASGETQALTSKNSGYISSVVQALNESLIHRG